jgi:hypothetical protein
MLCASLYWINLLPVQQATPSVRPRVPVEPANLGGGAVFDQTGLVSTQAKAATAVNTVADWQKPSTEIAHVSRAQWRVSCSLLYGKGSESITLWNTQV